MPEGGPPPGRAVPGAGLPEARRGRGRVEGYGGGGLAVAGDDRRGVPDSGGRAADWEM